ncbi:hypothetical protein JCM24511_01446 [Saitozyma sp. JCM 24511]|nr:hypothetical protein JCM24511_01446 [Saitozyma sp. JCM 24511]
MSEENPLHRAHALSAQASLLVRPTNTPPQVLQQALGAYREAADLFEASATAAATSPDDAAQRTLQLLTTQHRKLVRDLERRIASTPANVAGNNALGLGNPSMPGAGAAAAAARPDVTSIRRASEPVVPGSAGASGAGATGNEPAQARRNESTMLSLGGVGRGWINGATGIASRLAPSGTIPIPPFALRPPSFSPSDPTVPPPLPLPNPNPYASPNSNPNPNSSTPSKPAGSAHLPSAPPSVSLSPLASSSSSSDPAESYVNFGAVPDTLDPFSRFWGMLENMLDDISNPVAFASAPVSIPLSTVDEVLQRARGKTRKKEKDRERDKDKEKDKSSKRDKGRDREPSPSESYYVINKSKIPEEIQETQTKRNTSPVGKTAEELLMENESLKSSLDALATHAEALVKQNKELRQQAEEREKMMRSVVVGVRREVGGAESGKEVACGLARKAKQGQDLMRSQLVASASPFKPLDSGHPAVATTPTPTPTQLEDPGIVAGLKKRIRELEKEVESLKVDNEKQRAHVQKYRDRFDKIKTTSRAKKAEKEASATASIGSSGVDVGKPTPPRPVKSPEH